MPYGQAGNSEFLDSPGLTQEDAEVWTPSFSSRRRLDQPSRAPQKAVVGF